MLPLSPAEIPRRELEAVLRRLGHGEPSNDELDAVAAMAAQPPAPGGEDDLMEAFRVFDADGDGPLLENLSLVPVGNPRFVPVSRPVLLLRY